MSYILLHPHCYCGLFYELELLADSIWRQICLVESKFDERCQQMFEPESGSKQI